MPKRSRAPNDPPEITVRMFPGQASRINAGLMSYHLRRYPWKYWREGQPMSEAQFRLHTAQTHANDVWRATQLNAISEKAYQEEVDRRCEDRKMATRLRATCAQHARGTRAARAACVLTVHRSVVKVANINVTRRHDASSNDNKQCNTTKAQQDQLDAPQHFAGPVAAKRRWRRRA